MIQDDDYTFTLDDVERYERIARSVRDASCKVRTPQGLALAFAKLLECGEEVSLKIETADGTEDEFAHNGEPVPVGTRYLRLRMRDHESTCLFELANFSLLDALADIADHAAAWGAWGFRSPTEQAWKLRSEWYRKHVNAESAASTPLRPTDESDRSAAEIE